MINQGVKQVLDWSKWLEQSSVGYLVKPYTAKGIGGFVFTVRDEDRLEMRADITDYVTEDNLAVQSHIAIKPMVLTLRGFIGEVKQEFTDPLMGIVGTIATRLTAVEEYAPVLTTGAEVLYNQIKWDAAQVNINSIDALVKNTQNLATSFDVTLPGQTKQEQAFASLSSMFKTRQVMTVETPWGYFDSMAIMSLVCEQDSKTKHISDIVVTLKQLRFSDVLVREATQEEKRRLQEIKFLPEKIISTKKVSSTSTPLSSAKKGSVVNTLIGALN